MFDDSLARELRTHLEQQQEQQQASRAEDEEPPTAAEILSYASLAEAGRSDLVERVIDAGGYPAALQALGVEPKPEPPSKPASEQLAARRFTSAEIEGRLSLGAGRELRLEQPVTVGVASNAKTPQRQPAADDVPTASELSATKASNSSTSATETPPGEWFTLNGHERMGALALVILAAAGHGRSSMEMFNENAVTVLGGAANALFLMHGLLAVYASLIEARRFGRAPFLWFVKVLLAGPAAFVELERLGELKRET